MYLGVHTPKDVLVSLAIGAVLVLALYPVIDRCLDKPIAILSILSVMIAVGIGNLIFLHSYPFPADMDAVNYEDALETGWKLLGMVCGMCIVYPLDHYKIKFETEAVWWLQICKLLGGFAVVMAVRLALKTPLNLLLGAPIGGAVRYFLMVLTAGAAIPFLFRFLPISQE